MDLSAFLTVFLSWQVVLACLIIYVITYVFRKFMEGYFPSLKENVKWKEIYLGILPVFFGILFGLVSFPYPWPAELFSMFNRTMISMVCGMFCGWVYARVKGLIKASGVKIPVVGKLPPAEVIDETEEEVKE